MATRGTLKIMGTYHVKVDAVPTTDGKFSPVFEVWEGHPETGRRIHRDGSPASEEKYTTESEACEAAARMAGEWIDISAGI